MAGAGWLQAQITLPLRAVSTLLLVLIALVLLCLVGIGCVRACSDVGSLVALEMVATPLTRWLVVRPQEINLQAPYLAEAIEATRWGFKLDHIERQVYEPKTGLSATDLKQSVSTLSNVRLWDSTPLLEANRQLQQLRVYYRFSNAAVDRYPLNQDSDTAQQVILSARELDQSALPRRSRTWQNRHFIFTHGYGFTVSPVNDRSDDGLPSYFISDLGTDTRIEGNEALGIDQSEVRNAIPVGDAALYYGMLPLLCRSSNKIPEFDYPEGDLNVETHYRGSAGSPLDPGYSAVQQLFIFEPRLLTTKAIYRFKVTHPSRGEKSCCSDRSIYRFPR